MDYVSRLRRESFDRFFGANGPIATFGVGSAYGVEPVAVACAKFANRERANSEGTEDPPMPRGQRRACFIAE
jgi:hypothetical protein